ncbi:MAG: carbohydrate ABC transporter permease, partial [Paenibacillaceae bacterium]|nr:carbohydrate ABC transporter permease [Paenibacillaceae bacterium]
MKRNKKIRWFPIINTAILLTLALICIIPLIHVA